MPHVDWHRWDTYLHDGRNNCDRPVANNTRVHRVFGDEQGPIAFKLHSTDVVTIYPDGTRMLSSGGWRTLTTRDRIHEYGSRYVSGSIETSRSSAGTWHVRCEHDPKDPHPNGGQRAHRTLPKPFHALDPGPEPVKGSEDCVAGVSEPYSHCYETKLYGSLSDAKRPGDYVLPPTEWDKPGDLRVRRWANGTIEWTEHETYGGSERKQCPHCKAFDATHERWRQAFHGSRWGRNRDRGYSTMCEMLEQFGSREAWQAAYLTELREVREMNRKVKAWAERNYVEFHDGIIVEANGMVSLAAKREHCRALAEAERAERKLQRMRQRVERQQQRELAKIERRRSHRRAVMADVAKALAESAFTEAELKRRESFVH